MTFRCLVAVLAIAMMASHFNAVHGSSSPSPDAVKDQVAAIANIIKGLKDKTVPIVENFKTLIEKQVEEIKKFRSEHPDIDSNAELSARIGEAIRDNIQRAVGGQVAARIDSLNETTEQAIPVVENFKKLIESHVNEIKKFRSEHPNIEGDPQVSSKINVIIQDHIKKAVKTQIKDKVEAFVNSVRFATQVHNQRNETRQVQIVQREEDKSRHDSNHREQDRNREHERNREQERTREQERNHREQKINREQERNHREQERNHREQERNHREQEKNRDQDRNRQQDRNHREQDRNRDQDRVRNQDRNKEQDRNHREQDRNHREYTSSDSSQSDSRASDRHNNQNRKTPEQVQSLVSDIAGMVKALKSTIGKKVQAKKSIIESNLSKKFALLRQLGDNSQLADSNEAHREGTYQVRSHELEASIGNQIRNIFADVADGNTRSPGGVETEAHRALRNKIEEKYASVFGNFEESKQEFVESKEELASAARKLHESYSEDRDQSKPFNFSSLLVLKSKVQELIKKKAQFVQNKIALNQKLSQAVVNAAWSSLHTGDSTPSSGSSTGNEEHPEVTTSSAVNSAGDGDSSQNAAHAAGNSSGLKMAASGFNGADRAAAEEEGPTVVIVIVLSCLVIAAIVGLLSVVVWRRHRRHRLYVRIPGGHAAERAEQ
jgi:hypothetical protein